MLIDSKAVNAEPDSVPVDAIPDLVRVLRATMMIAQSRGFSCFNAIVPSKIAILRGRYAAKYGQILARTL